MTFVTEIKKTLTTVKNLIFGNFDWDDNIIFMPTKIIFFAKDLNNQIQELAVSTEGFAHCRSHVGVHSFIMSFKNIEGTLVQCEKGTAGSIEIDLINYQVIYENDESFREFRDHDSINYFMDDLKMALAHKKFGPSFNDFVECCNNEEAVKNVKIITARGQSPATIHEGLRYLQAQGYIKHIPMLKNIYPVSYKGPELDDKYKALASSPQEAKMKVLAEVLDYMSEHHMGATFGFSDDDKKTHDFTESFIKAEIEKNRWSNIQINLYFTGNKTKQRTIMLNITETDVA